ncbi:MAG: hypothetical protein J5762_03980 [Clostridia bacterium]|nr:hypothetical protein [Clostridia bacterium]
MKIRKTTETIVCSVPGCGNLADYVVTTDGGATEFVCKKCLKEAADAFAGVFKGSDKSVKNDEISAETAEKGERH